MSPASATPNRGYRNEKLGIENKIASLSVFKFMPLQAPLQQKLLSVRVSFFPRVTCSCEVKASK